jgi:DNA-binding NtrC family response regulator
MTTDKNKPGNKRAEANTDAREPQGPEKEPNDMARTGKVLLVNDNEIFSAAFPSERSLNEITRGLKRFFVNAALRRSGGSRQGAARLLRISRYSLKHYMKTLGYSEEE